MPSLVCVSLLQQGANILLTKLISEGISNNWKSINISISIYLRIRDIILNGFLIAPHSVWTIRDCKIKICQQQCYQILVP